MTAKGLTGGQAGAAAAARVASQASSPEAGHPPGRQNLRRNPGETGWVVSIRRSRPSPRLHSRTFLDRQYGGEAGALAAAQAWRDEQERLHPKLSRRERAARVSKHNTSGKTGVLRYATTRQRADGSAVIDEG